MPLSTALTAEETGITPFLLKHLGPLFADKTTGIFLLMVVIIGVMIANCILQNVPLPFSVMIQSLLIFYSLPGNSSPCLNGTQTAHKELPICKKQNSQKPQSAAHPSLSAAVKELEEELGFEILHRSKRGVSFTVPGQAVLQEAKFMIRVMLIDITDHNNTQIQLLFRNQFYNIIGIILN